MTDSPVRHDPLRRYLSAWIGFSAGGPFSQALSVAVLLYAFGLHTIRALIGWPGSVAVLATLVVLAVLSLAGSRGRIDWHGILPVSLLAFFGYLAASIFWSQYTWVSVGGVAYALGFAVLGMFLALGRDLVQVIRAVGDAMRILLTVSLSLEILSGLLIDTPITFLGIQGSLANGGPIQGIAGTRNFLGFLAALALVTFVVEWLTRSVTREIAVASTIVAVITLFFVSSPVTSIAVLFLVVATIALRSLRQATPHVRPVLQGVLLVVVLLGAAFAYAFRSRLIATIGATTDLETRLALWGSMRPLTDFHPIIGWGFAGAWPIGVFPFSVLPGADGRPQASGLGVIFDAWLQIGAVGGLLLLAAGSLAFVRSWLTASSHPIVAYVWPPLVLVLLAVTDLAESYLLFEGGLMLFVTLATVSARKRSWRHRLAAA